MDDVIRFGFQCPDNGVSIEGEWDCDARRMTLCVDPAPGDDPSLVAEARAFCDGSGRFISGECFSWSNARTALINRGVHPYDL